jgi:hypothetical protein
MNSASRERDPSAPIPSALFLLFTPDEVTGEVIAIWGRGRSTMRMAWCWKRECGVREKGLRIVQRNEAEDSAYNHRRRVDRGGATKS